MYAAIRHRLIVNLRAETSHIRPQWKRHDGRLLALWTTALWQTVAQGLPLTTRLTTQVNLKREKLELSPVYSTAVDHDGHKLGYIRLVNFGQHAALDMQHAVQKLQACTCMAPLPLPEHTNLLRSFS